MTDKVQKIKDWISKEQDGLMDAQGNFEYPEHEGAYHILCNLDTYIDSLQEKPVSKLWHKGNEFEGVDYMRQYRWVIGNMENKRFAVGPCLEVEGGAIDILDGGGGIEMCVREEDSWAYIDDILNLTHLVNKTSDQEEPVSERFAFKAIPRLLEMIEPTDRAKAYTAKLAETLEVEGYSTDAKIVKESLKMMNGKKVPMATMDEEPVSKNLEDAAKRYSDNENPICTCEECLLKSFKAGAKWQKNKNNTIVGKDLKQAADNALESISDQYDIISVGSCLEMFRLGAKWKKEQMMAKAINTEASLTLSVPSICISLPRGVNVGDKVKIIVIKED